VWAHHWRAVAPQGMVNSLVQKEKKTAVDPPNSSSFCRVGDGKRRVQRNVIIERGGFP